MSIDWLNNNDNIFKFLFIAGCLFIGFSFIYPFEKRQQLELELNQLKQDNAILKVRLDAFYKLKKSQQDSLLSKQDRIQLVIDNATQAKKNLLYSERTEILQKQIDRYSGLYTFFTFLGWALFLVGGAFWVYLTCKSMTKASAWPNFKKKLNAG